MPNTVAYLVLFSWPLVAVLAFAAQPPARALSLAVVVGYLLLPERTGVDFPMIPVIDKVTVINLTAAVVVYLSLRRERAIAGMAPPPPVGRARWLFFALMALTLVTPFVTVLTNGEPVIAGPRYIQGIRLYDAVSLMTSAAITIVPFVLGMRVLDTRGAQIELLRVLVLAACAYAFFVLFEARMSPQLHAWLYGFFPHSFGQHIRGGMFRPVVFLGHGLLLGIFFCMAVLGACALWRQALRDSVKAAPLWLMATLWLAMTLLLSRNFGATALALMFAPLIFFAPPRLQVLGAAVVAGMVLLYPMLRGAGLVPIEAVHAMAQSISEERAASLQYRLDQEEALLARANEKPLAGWGSWGRNRIHDPVTGRDISVTDGLWVITIGQFGWFGYLAQFGLLTMPLLLLAWYRQDLTPEAAGLTIVTAAGLIDLIPNAGLTPVTWIVAGALAARAASYHGEPITMSGAGPTEQGAAQWFVTHPGGPLVPAGSDGPASHASDTGVVGHQRAPRL